MSTSGEAERAQPSSRMREATAVIAEYIARSELKPGDRLPSEHEVMAALGIGRSTVREVMRHFQALGVVETRRGSGSFLLKPVSGATLHLPLSIEPGPVLGSPAPAHALDICRALEAEAAMLAARRATDADVEALRIRLEALEAAHGAAGTAAPEILAFRRAVFDVTGNPLFAQIADQMRPAGGAAPFERPDVSRRCFSLFRELFEAIGRSRPMAARDAAARIFAVLEEDAAPSLA